MARGPSDLKRALTFGGQAPLSVGVLIAGMAVATVGGTLWAPLARLLTLEVPTLETPSWVVLLEAWRLLTWPFFQGPLPGSLLTLLFAGFMLLWLGRQLSYAWSERRFLVRFAVLSAGSGLGTLLLLGPFGYPIGYFGIWAVLNALLLTWEATPAPKLVIAVGACACSGGVFRDSPVQSNGMPGVPEIPVDLWVAGCPPHPITFLDGVLRLLGRVEGDGLRLSGTGIVEPRP